MLLLTVTSRDSRNDRSVDYVLLMDSFIMWWNIDAIHINVHVDVLGFLQVNFPASRFSKRIYV